MITKIRNLKCLKTELAELKRRKWRKGLVISALEVANDNVDEGDYGDFTLLIPNKGDGKYYRFYFSLWDSHDKQDGFYLYYDGYTVE